MDFSKELCGGTHTSALGTIGLLKIEKESSIAAGSRRIEAVTGDAALTLIYENENLLEAVSNELKCQPMKIKERLEKLLEEHKTLSTELKALKKKELQAYVLELFKKVESHGNKRFLIAQVEGGPEDLKSIADELFSKLSSPLILALGLKTKTNVHLLVRVSDDLVGQGRSANSLLQEVTPLIDGAGGGKANYAQAKGNSPDKLNDALNKLRLSLTS